MNQYEDYLPKEWSRRPRRPGISGVSREWMSQKRCNIWCWSGRHITSAWLQWLQDRQRCSQHFVILEKIGGRHGRTWRILNFWYDSKNHENCTFWRYHSSNSTFDLLLPLTPLVVQACPTTFVMKHQILSAFNPITLLWTTSRSLSFAKRHHLTGEEWFS